MSSKKDKQQRIRETDELFDKVREQVADARRLSAKFAERARGAEPPMSCPKHPIGTEQPCGPCGTARLRHLIWERGSQASKGLGDSVFVEVHPTGFQPDDRPRNRRQDPPEVVVAIHGVEHLPADRELRLEFVTAERFGAAVRDEPEVDGHGDSSSPVSTAVGAADDLTVGAAVDGDGPVASSPPGEATPASVVVRVAMSEEQRQRLLLALSTARASYMDRHFRAVQELAASETKERRESFAGIASDWAREADLVDELSSLIGGAVRP